ncbi:hypothetical protein M3Y98_00858100 [Aphelenchoides besseyi]|nr:hypothetical protein M3Y98_00858100 [Aphelenchoides besseyi]KAI6211150.1 hypothetical protein M3Y96_00403200 [Aphelenchoides besseyi]
MEIKVHDLNEFPYLLNKLNGNVRLINVYCVLKFCIDGCYIGSTITIRSIDSRYFGVTLELLDGENLIVVLQTDANDRPFVHNATTQMLLEIQNTMDKYDEILFSSLAPSIAPALYAHFNSTTTHPFMPLNERALMFYANKEQRQKLKSTELQLPDGFEFIELPVDAAKAICEEVIALKLKNQERLIASKIEHYPAIGIRHTASGELATYATNDGTGLISNVYTRPKFRRLGFAKLIEQKLAQINLETHGLWPFKGVGLNRPRVIAMTNNFYLWSVVPTGEMENESNNLAYHWIARTKTHQEPIVFLEN